ncbi:membrane protein insertion efficiency factor YidD [Candidatus Kuenenbacteria bacterium]|nr:membrane protein insertion efficiency factor YidD [Candidatus Kuenenbacteria bacterium]OIP76649.1 MAG: membrane protein insertion efficiency factor YidD [Parcubacteria group bacterium CG2_30_36_38]PJC00851.1 MAG: membrane protein insertion efficiency factor YidD [bacterium (Candidatus Moisslbacteria) CG_4_9_14_0_8_um_filter_36_20]
MFKKIILKTIRFYQKVFSPDHGFFSFLFYPGVCRFRPTCSDYAALAIEKYGLLVGLRKSFLRVLRCHPLSKGGFDEP